MVAPTVAVAVVVTMVTAGVFGDGVRDEMKKSIAEKTAGCKSQKNVEEGLMLLAAVDGMKNRMKNGAALISTVDPMAVYHVLQQSPWR